MALITGGPEPDALTGTAGQDIILGLGGADVITGREGNDVILAGLGDDTVAGDNAPRPGGPIEASDFGPFPPASAGYRATT